MRTIALLTAVSVACCTGALAQETGNPEAGQIVAEEACSVCHAVLAGEGVGPDPAPLPFEALEALPFEDIANTPGITEMALYAWMTTSHPTMPNIVLNGQELSDVVAYILSLKDEQT